MLILVRYLNRSRVRFLYIVRFISRFFLCLELFFSKTFGNNGETNGARKRLSKSSMTALLTTFLSRASCGSECRRLFIVLFCFGERRCFFFRGRLFAERPPFLLLFFCFLRNFFFFFPSFCETSVSGDVRSNVRFTGRDGCAKTGVVELCDDCDDDPEKLR